MAWQAFKQISSPSELAKLEVQVDSDDVDERQVKAAVKAARQLLGVIGDGETFNVWLSGHTTAGDGPDDGTHDHISVAVAIAAYPGHAARHPQDEGDGNG